VHEHFVDAELPGEPGWRSWDAVDRTRFNALLGSIAYRVEGEGPARRARVRMHPERRHSNLRESVHGGAILAFIDVALFAGARAFGLLEAGTAVTLGLDTQFIGGGTIGEPLDAEVELLRETGRLLFLRGLVVQGETKVAAFSGTVRKPTLR
jgi:acyl-coenzyme A thioesterase PaaI-like protein